MRVLQADSQGVATAVEALRQGRVVAYPTETVYGLGADPQSVQALDRLFAVKGRAGGVPVLLVIGALDQLEPFTTQVSNIASAFMNRFWPGPLSLLLPARETLDERLRGTGGKVCVRWSPHPVAQALCNVFPGAITSTSANRSAETPARAIEEIHLPGVEIALDGGRLEGSAPSTVYDPDAGVILRTGAIDAETLAKFRRDL